MKFRVAVLCLISKFLMKNVLMYFVNDFVFVTL